MEEIVVTETMIAAGMEELREHHYGDDLRYVLEQVFRAMAYAQPPKTGKTVLQWTYDEMTCCWSYRPPHSPDWASVYDPLPGVGVRAVVCWNNEFSVHEKSFDDIEEAKIWCEYRLEESN